MPVSQLNAREIDLHNTGHVKGLILEIESEENRKRRRHAWQAYQCLEGNQKEYVQDELRRIYPETYDKFRVGDISIPKKVIDKKAKSYKQVPARSLDNDKETEDLNAIYDEFHFHRSFKEWDRIFNYHKYGFMWLTWQNPEERQEEEGRYVMHALAPYEFDLVKDQKTGEPLIFILNYPDTTVTQQAGGSDATEQTIAESQSDTSSETKVYAMWSSKQFAKVQIKRAKGHGNANKEQVSVTFLKKAENEIGRLPGAYLQKDAAIDYPVPSNLHRQSISWNVSFSDLKTAAATQGHGQLVIKHPEGQPVKQAHMGMYTALALPQSKRADSPATEAEYISASPDLPGQLSVLKFDLMNILDEQGIQAKGALEGGVEKFSSGFDRLLSEADVQDVIEDNQNMYSRTIEQDIFLTLQAYEEAMNKGTFKSERLDVSFEKPKVLISDKETLDNLKLRDELGTILDYEKHMILDPNLDEEQAKEREAEIQEQKKKQQEEAIAMMQRTADVEIAAEATDDEPEEDDDAEA